MLCNIESQRIVISAFLEWWSCLSAEYVAKHRGE